MSEKINFKDIPCDIKKTIYKINKKSETMKYNNDNMIYYCWYSKKSHKVTGCAYEYESINNNNIVCTLLTKKHNQCNFKKYDDYKFVGMTKKINKFIKTIILKE